jgi:HEPN domain-containing protein
MSQFGQSSYWFESAEYDLQTARAMLETQRLLYVGFMCHQTIEKALKGIFVARKPEEELPYIHKLMRLANLSGLSGEMTEEQLSLLDTLSPLNIVARYPLHKSKLLESLTVERCEKMIQETEALFLWIRKKC